MSAVAAFIALGSNLGNPAVQLTTAIGDIDLLPKTSVTATSRFYRSAPIGPQEQPDYINAVIKIVTSLAPLELLDHLQGIEQRHGRRRHLHWGPRTLDLDILLYGDAIIDLERLQIPHPQMTFRNFVIYPLADIAPTLCLPGGVSITQLLANLPSGGIVSLSNGD
ncbi:MAG: 2-amino-4-hydroxy-6-hydroxymethyldihydropteridine diphosphokinase [Porticoccaceae bacterium]|nr:2-amino-4-hydroxy-6-hydroxymethyldihydropteridine diphosphokinase [Porticoccaceae bacterium]